MDPAAILVALIVVAVHVAAFALAAGWHAAVVS